MKTTVFAFYDTAIDAHSLCKVLGYKIGEMTLRSFPDEEAHIRFHTERIEGEVLFLVGLDRPNAKLLPLLFAAETVRSLGAEKVTLIAPYLPYMRQDVAFNPGEGVTSRYFAGLISQYFDALITIDPHLHRFSSLDEIYSIPNQVLHAHGLMADWIRLNVSDPVIVGPDQESEQWVSEVARSIDAPYIIAEKTRKGDREVIIDLPHMKDYQEHTPVLVDDIISSGQTMIQAVKQLNLFNRRSTVCLGVHAVFAGEAYEHIKASGVSQIVTSNTIRHVSNQIDITSLIAKYLGQS